MSLTKEDDSLRKTRLTTSSESFMASRLTELSQRVPPCTFFLICFCVLIFIIMFFTGGLEYCAISAEYILYKYQIYRIYTSTFVHVSILHIIFNMMSLFSLLPPLERKYGSVFMFYMTFLFSTINGLMYVLIYYLLSFISATNLSVTAAGFSGVIFSFLTITAYVSQEEKLAIFGLIYVPKKWFAITYLVLMSVLMPTVSFVGHLCGVISGFMFVSGYLNWAIPMRCIIAMEKGFIGSLMKKSDSFSYIPEIHEMIGSALSLNRMLSLAWDGLLTLCSLVIHAIKGVSLFIFDSIFPPVHDINHVPLPASAQNSDIETQLSKEEIRKQRLAALSQN